MKLSLGFPIYLTLSQLCIQASPFYEKPIDYFQDAKELPQAESTFDWREVMDINSDEYFREGDYLPPAAFMEVARRPTEKNIQNWLTYQEHKQELTNKLNQRINRYVKKKNSFALKIIAKKAEIKSKKMRQFTRFLEQNNLHFELIPSQNAQNITIVQLNPGRSKQHDTDSISQNEYELIKQWIKNKKGEEK